ncbi:MAG: bifunctional DNA-formamidopyrimidine glycosylase/DNA-(apurinic or apyrimidinic site) lyase [Planctomycetota bacterium]
MPELPEVETVVRHLRPQLTGRRIEGARIRWERTLGGMSPERFDEAVAGATVSRVWRRAKYIVIDLDPGGCLVGHLRMTGRMLVGPDPGAYVVVSLDLDDGRALHFLDVRKFGRLLYAAAPGDVLPALGPEPLGDEFTAAWFRAALRGRKRQLKPLLLDQSFLAGLGNIYVDEALHRARLHPLRAADRVRGATADRLHGAIREILAAAVEHEGSTFDGFYVTPEGKPGSYQHKFHVYGRDGQPCPRCGAAIRKLVVAQRGTHVCPRCQRAPALRQ